jgi:predicted RND superfamily exporter protein
MFTLIGVMSSSVFRLTVDTATESMLHKNDPSLIEYNKYRDQFGRTDVITIVVEAPDLFDKEFLRTLSKLQSELKEDVPYLKKVTSLISVRDTHEKKGTLYVDELMKDFETRDIAGIKKRALENPFYSNYILSSDKKSTAIMLETVAKVSDNPEKEKADDDDLDDLFDEEEKSKEKDTYHYISANEKSEVNAAVRTIISKYHGKDFKLTFSGGSVVVDVFNNTTSADTKRLMKIMTVVIIIFLFLLFRRISGVIMPFVIVNASMLSTLGLMAFTDTPISLMTNLLPGFLVAVGIADAVHVLTIFYRKYETGVSKEDAICYAMGHSGLAIVMTSITTAAGLLSFAVAEVATISEMGYFASAGVMLALLFTIILLPALIAVTPIARKEPGEKKENSDRMSRFLTYFADVSIRYPRQIVIISFFLFVVSIYYISQLHFSSFILSYFPDKHPVKIDLKYIESKLEGSVAFEVVIDTGKENGLYDPGILMSIERLTDKISRIKTDSIYVGKIVTINDIIKETNQALHENRKEYYSIPSTRKKIAENLFMFENGGSDDLEQICDSIFRKTRFSIRTKWADSVEYEQFLDQLYIMFREEFKGRAEITVTGLSAIMARTIPAALKSMLDSYVIALVVITILMLVLVGDLKLGLLSMNPNLLPIFMVMGMISIAGYNLDINTLFIGSIALGLVVDDTIHFMYNFKKYYDITGSPEAAIRKTLQGTGRAMLITSIVLSLNFFVLLTATLNHSIKFGLFTGIAIILALFADFLLAPALMMLANKERKV